MTFDEVLLRKRIRELEKELQEVKDDREFLTVLLETQVSDSDTNPFDISNPFYFSTADYVGPSFANPITNVLDDAWAF